MDPSQNQSNLPVVKKHFELGVILQFLIALGLLFISWLLIDNLLQYKDKVNLTVFGYLVILTIVFLWVGLTLLIRANRQSKVNIQIIESQGIQLNENKPLWVTIYPIVVFTLSTVIVGVSASETDGGGWLGISYLIFYGTWAFPSLVISSISKKPGTYMPLNVAISLPFFFIGLYYFFSLFNAFGY